MNTDKTAIPADIQALIGSQSWFFKHEDALRHREGLMEERKKFVQLNTSERFERAFSLCEVSPEYLWNTQPI